MKELIVVKFGGTSVADGEKRASALERIGELRERGYLVAAVVSAMGRKGAPYATDTLLSLIAPDASPVARDLIMSCGETISACVFADTLEKAGMRAVPMNGVSAGIKTNGVHIEADVTAMDVSAVRRALEGGMVPVITGFQGLSPEGEITTLGRGGSDTSAVEIGGYLGAKEVLIYTDVPGVADADPRAVPGARYMDAISYGDMLLLSKWGAGVVHPRAVEKAEAFRVPVRVLSTFDKGDGTLIAGDVERSGFIGTALKKPATQGEPAVVTALCRPMDAETLTKARAALPGITVEKEGELLHAYVDVADAFDALNKLCNALR